MTETLLEIFMDKNLLLTFGTIVITVLYVTTGAMFFKRAKRRAEEKEFRQKRTFYNALTEGLKNDTINSLGDLVNIYKGARNLSSEDLTYRSNLSRLLREYLVYLVTEKMEKPIFAIYSWRHEESKIESVSPEKLAEYKAKITEFINDNDKASPYADLPAVERSIVTDISTYSQSDNKESVLRKLNELASTIQAREDSIKRIQSTNKWSVPLAIVGLILTAVFGVLSVF
ncbi:MAG: hypothetical protein OET90_00945 [Desulfuromonadales bacterium]|nr:hypothetical protein [Desulfuromonadales bacterium]